MERIKLENVTKKFTRKIKKENRAFLAHLIGFFNKNRYNFDFAAVKSISFSVQAGEILGIIGKNGSGKSTLLKLVAGIYQPDSGTITTEGSMIYVTGFGQGIKNKLTMKENIYLLGTVMGLSKKEVDSKLSEIIEFSGLNEYLYTPVYQFSSGMVSRLSFSIAIHCLEHRNPDILLFDEVFSAGGDIDFQEKGVKKMEELIKKGAAVILVSHSLDMINKYCHKAILLENGRVAFLGPSGETIKNYLNAKSI